MTPRIHCQTIRLPTTRPGVTERGFLVFAEDQLMAVVAHLYNSVDDDLRDSWFIEVGFGPCALGPGTNVVFQTPGEAQQWVLDHMARASGAEPP